MVSTHIQNEGHLLDTALVLQEDAALLASRMPRLMLTARNVSRQAYAGIHGRRRAGSGENFWQYRPFSAGESVSRIDWRRSGRDDHLYIREREWEAAHTVWIGLDRSRSMGFLSEASEFSKLDKAIILTLALADILVQGGERVGIIGLSAPSAHRTIIAALGNALATQSDYMPFAPEPERLSPNADVVLISDFLAPAAEHSAMLARFPAGHNQRLCLAIADPAEENFPFSGRTEFRDPENTARLTLGRAQNTRERYQQIYHAHRETLAHETQRQGWSMISHRTDHPATEALLALHAQLAQR